MIAMTLQTFCGLIADGWGVGGIPLGGVQRWRHCRITVLEVCLWAGGLGSAEGAREPLIVPGLTAAVALAVHRALVQQVVLVSHLVPLLHRWALARVGPPWLLRWGYLLWLRGAQQTSHRQHPLNGLFCGGWGRTFSAGAQMKLITTMPQNHKYSF